MRPVWAEIDLKAIAHNVKTLKSLTKPGVLFMAVVKADGYGHGAVPVARAALEGGADRFGVALSEEGAELRKANIKAPIQILSEISPDDHSLTLAVENDLIPAICQAEVAEALSEAAKRQGKTVKVHVKVDTGMGRLGIPAEPQAALEFIELVRGLENLEIEGVFSHFAMADKPAEPVTAEQFGKFKVVLEALEAAGVTIPLKHTANSAALMAFPETHLDMVRPGIAIYGLPPAADQAGKVDLKPALSFKTKILFLKDVPTGQGISYGHTYVAPGPRKAATLPLGYADGYSRLLSNKSEVLVKGRRASEIGTITMDQIMVDVSDILGVRVGDEVVLIGRQGTEEITADEIAALIGTINYEVVCMISKRVPRVYV